MVEPARVCAISCVVEGKFTVISARVIYRLGALCDSRGLRSPTVCYPLTASALELFPTHHTTRGRACLLPFTLAMRFVHAMWRCDMPLAEYKHGRVGTLMQCFNCSSGHNRVRQWHVQLDIRDTHSGACKLQPWLSVTPSLRVPPKVRCSAVAPLRQHL